MREPNGGAGLRRGIPLAKPLAMMADLIRDFRYAVRSLARTPGFTVVAVVVLALGIGANSAIFSLVSAVWLKPLQFADAERPLGYVA